MQRCTQVPCYWPPVSLQDPSSAVQTYKFSLFYLNIWTEQTWDGSPPRSFLEQTQAADNLKPTLFSGRVSIYTRYGSISWISSKTDFISYTPVSTGLLYKNLKQTSDYFTEKCDKSTQPNQSDRSILKFNILISKLVYIMSHPNSIDICQTCLTFMLQNPVQY